MPEPLRSFGHRLRPYVPLPNMLCILPNTAIRVDVRHPHPCGGWYLFESWCYGPHGRIGYYHRDV